MGDTNKSTGVTYGQFFLALSMIWLYLALVIGIVTDIQGENTSWTTYLLWGASLLMGLGYSFLATRAMSRKV